MREIERKQIKIIKAVKNYFMNCKKNNVDISTSPNCYMTTWTSTRGYFKLLKILKKKCSGNFFFLIKDILGISLLFDYDIYFNKNSIKKNNLLISYCSKKNFDKNGNFDDPYFNLNSSQKFNSWFLISLDGYIPKNLKEDIYIFYKKSKKKISLLFLIKEIFYIFMNNLLSFQKLSHLISKQYIFGNLIINAYKETFYDQDFKNVVINYEGIPFQHALINFIKKKNVNTKIICYLHCAGWPLQTDLIYRHKKIDLLLVSGVAQKKNLTNNLGWPSRKIKVIPSLRFKKRKNEFSGYIFVPFELPNKNTYHKSFENYLKKIKIKSLNNLKLRIHPLNDGSKKHKIFSNHMQSILNKYKNKFNNKKKKNTSVIFGSATGVSLQALEDGVKIIHFPKDISLDIFTKKMWPSINVKVLKENIFSYEIKKKNSIFWVKNKRANFNKYVVDKLTK